MHSQLRMEIQLCRWIAPIVGRMNHVSGARHAIVIENGTLGNLPINFPAGTGGFTVASEEPAYILGNYNANDSSLCRGGVSGDPHASSAVIADTVTLLSKNWNNEQSMFNPRARGRQRNLSGELHLWPALPATDQADKLAQPRIEWRLHPAKAFHFPSLREPAMTLELMAVSITSFAIWKNGAARLRSMKAHW